jgi:putative DNA primase/helicase
LSVKHAPCPVCGGKDRFRFIDTNGCGSFYCTHCAGGTGVELVMNFRRIAFVEAVQLIKSHIGGAKVVSPKATASDEKRRTELRALWSAGMPLDGSDIASRYLASRGIERPCWPCLRWVASLPQYDEQGKSSVHPAMLARFAAPDDNTATLFRTWLGEPGLKAAVDQPKKMLGPVPVGGAVRLGEPAEFMGIAEGIESALSASILYRLPVWSACSSVFMVKWRPPKEARTVVIFADADESFAGQRAAYSLAARLHDEGLAVKVMTPPEGEDFNDVLMLT